MSSQSTATRSLLEGAEADSNNAVSEYNAFYIENDTVGNYNSHIDTSTSFSHGSTAECIVERLAVNGTPTHLANFNTVAFNGCDFTLFHTDGTADIEGVGNIPHSMYTIFHTSVTPNKQLDRVGSIDTSGENYTISWIASS